MGFSDAYNLTKLPDEISLRLSWTGGASPTFDDGGTKSVASVTKLSTGKFRVTLNTPRPMKNFPTVKPLVVLSSVDTGADLGMEALIESYTGSTGILDIWFYAATQPAGVSASATFTADTNANMADGDIVTLNTGISIKTYEYDKSANGVTAGRVSWTAGTTALSVAQNLRTAILANQPELSVTDNGDGTLTIVNRWIGAAGNNTNSKTSASALAITNFTGGLTTSAAPVLQDPNAGSTVTVSISGSLHA